MESILTSIKKLLGLSENNTDFDDDVIIHINSVFMTLTQLGVGPSTGFYIEDATSEWTDFVTDITKTQAIKTYVFLKVKLVFDPGSVGSSTLAAYERQIQELEWRLNIAAETNENTNDSSTSDPIGGTVSGPTDDGIKLVDRTRKTSHTLYVDNNKLVMEENT